MQLADIEAIDLPTASIDAVHTDRVLQHVPDPSAVITYATRLLRAGGRAVFAEPDWRTLVIDHPEPRLPEAFATYVVEHQVRNSRLGSALPRLCRGAGLTVETVVPVTTTFDTLAAADRVLGFARVTQRAVEHGLLTRHDARRWLDGLSTSQVFAAVTLVMVTTAKTT